LRYFNVFGCGQDPQSQYAAVVPLFISAFLDGSQITVNGDGEQSRDFTFIDNVVQANILAATAPKAAGEVFNIACGARMTLNQMLNHIRTFTENDTEVIYGPSRSGDVKHSQADIQKARDILNYNPIVSAEMGLRLSVEWYRAVRKKQ